MIETRTAQRERERGRDIELNLMAWDIASLGCVCLI